MWLGGGESSNVRWIMTAGGLAKQQVPEMGSPLGGSSLGRTKSVDGSSLLLELLRFLISPHSFTFEHDPIVTSNLSNFSRAFGYFHANKCTYLVPLVPLVLFLSLMFQRTPD